MDEQEIRDYVIHHLDTAIQNHWLQVYYQPVIRTLTGELCGLEALSRWVDPQVGFLSPAAFIPVLEEAQLIHKLDTYVLREVCRMLRGRFDAGLPVTPVSFNLSRLDFSMLNIFALIEGVRSEFDLPRDLLHIEVTESAMAKDLGPIRQTIDKLRAEGYEVWIDDFGSGYSSLNILKDCTIDLIKLDMGFLRTFTEKSRKIIASVIDMAKELGIKTLAEGVETQEQADFLASIGCGRQQVYFYGRPEPLPSALTRMQEQGRTIELRMWHHYYDVASAAIRATNQPLALFEFYDDSVHYLYATPAYREQLMSTGYDLTKASTALNDATNPFFYQNFREFFLQARASQQTETYFYVENGSYILVRISILYEANGHTLVLTECRNISQDTLHLENQKLDRDLRYLYWLFEYVHIVNFAEDSIEPLFIHTSPLHTPLQQKCYGIRQQLHDVSEHLIYEEDRQRYLDFYELSTIVSRIEKSPHNRISDQFRLIDAHGNYNWREFIVMLVPNSGSRLLLSLVQCIDEPCHKIHQRLKTCPAMTAPPASSVGSPAAVCRPGSLSHECLAPLLWKSLQQNSHICYFWKDRKRRFLGASKAFLAYYGFTSEQVILGKTDEDMNWHVNGMRYQADELAVIEQGHVVRGVPGQCIARGVLRHIVCYKWPLYKDGQIVGLMGAFFDTDTERKRLAQESASSYEDIVTGLWNRQGFLDALNAYSEQYRKNGQGYTLTIFEGRFDERLASTYGRQLLTHLLQEEARRLRELAGKDSVIARLRQFTFTILRRDAGDKSTEGSAAGTERAEELAAKIQQSLHDIHEIDGNPVTISFRYSVVHAAEAGRAKKDSQASLALYRQAIARLRHR
ncbi:EAL domain-containing protein [uncultured Mitsuokella sp.]|uniref:EAL domain-containing protein n=1 Tax=uncultured Mitsuokella sp. TaxID=453120 RepID=UPI0026DC3A33|nr:EAL domain-containing protein [uncultured Mitsuokella sp.]